MDNFYLASLVPSTHHLEPTILSILPRPPSVMSQLISHTLLFVPNQSPYDVICCIPTPPLLFSSSIEPSFPRPLLAPDLRLPRHHGIYWCN
jgi:hypothetical protein